MHDFMEILSFFAYDIEAVKKYVEALESEPSRQNGGRLRGPGGSSGA